MNKDKHIPQGYKDSPLGIIPKEWEVKRICDFGQVITGSTPPTNDADNYGSAYMFVGPVDITESKYIKSTEKYLSEKGFSISRNMPKGSVLFTCIGSTIGKCAIADENLTSNQQINAVICNSNHNEEFLYYELTNRSNKIRLIAGEQAVPIINKSTFENIRIVCPPLIEQERIVSVLSLWDTAIEKQSELIEKLKLRKRALMQQLLTGKKRLSGFNREWKHVPIKTFAKEVSNRNVGGVNHIVLSCTKYDGLVPSLEYFGKQIYSNDLSSYKIIPQGHFAYATNHIEEGSIGYQSNYENGLISPMYTVFVTNKEKVNDTFLYSVLKSHHLIYLYKSMMEGSINRRGGLRWDSFSTIKIDLPSLEEQNAIASVLVKADKEIELAKEKFANLQSQKRGLMQQLLTGKKRI